MASLLGMVSANPIVEVTLDGGEGRKSARFKDKDNTFKLPVYMNEDDISGTVEVKLNKAKKFEHMGIRVEIVGRIEVPTDKTNSSDFMSNGKELEPAGALFEDKTYKFSFNKFEKEFESYYGQAVNLRYFIRVTINRNYVPKIVKEVDFAVLKPVAEPETAQHIKMEVGIEDCLHIEFEYDKNKYHLKDVVIGKVYFFLVKIKIKYMEICIVKKETIGSGANAINENETLAKYEVMDGCPAKGEVIPIRIYLSAYDLAPSCLNVGNKFSSRHFLNLVLVDEEERRYFKQQEITLWRKKI